MIKLRNTLVAAIAIAVLTISSVLAGSFGAGISLKSMDVDSSGTESDGTSTGASATDASTRTKNLSETAQIGSYYLEYSTDAASWATEGNGWTIGFESIPGKANLSGKTLTRVDTSEGKGAAGDASGVSNFSAQAQIENHSNIYVEVPLFRMLYIKAGQSSLDIITDETVATNHGTYGNASVDGVNYGIGVKGMFGSNIKWKAAFEETDYDSVTLKSTTNNQIKADLDTSEFNISLGYQF